MKVPADRMIRNNSGSYACPNCWYHPNAAVYPTDANCPNCGIDLEWDPEVVAHSKTYTDRKRQ